MNTYIIVTKNTPAAIASLPGATRTYSNENVICWLVSIKSGDDPSAVDLLAAVLIS